MIDRWCGVAPPPLAVESTPDDRREFGARLHALKRRLHPLTLHPDLPALYTRYHDAASPEDKVALGKDIVRVQRTIDDTEHASVFGAIDRAFAEVGNGHASAQVQLLSLSRSSPHRAVRALAWDALLLKWGCTLTWGCQFQRIRVRFFSPARRPVPWRPPLLLSSSSPGDRH